MTETAVVSSPERYRSGPLQRTEKIGSGLGSFTVRLYWTPQDGSVMWVDFELFACTATSMDGKDEYFQRRDAINGWDTVSDLDHAECAAHGYVKWDGCMEFDIEHTHVCSGSQLHELFSAVEQTRRLCAASMPGQPVAEEYPATGAPAK